MIYDFVIGNKELFKFVYALIITIICITIVIKTNKLYQISSHQGIRYFRNAFFFYGLAFVIRYHIEPVVLFTEITNSYYSLTRFLFEFFLIIAGFSLLYSLVWKNFEKRERASTSSLLNPRIIIFYLIAIVLVILDYFYQPYFFMFLSQISIFIYASFISYINYKRGGGKHKFLRLYFIAIILNLIAWTTNFIVAVYLNWNSGIVINLYIVNLIIFLLFLYGIVKVTKKW